MLLRVGGVAMNHRQERSPGNSRGSSNAVLRAHTAEKSGGGENDKESRYQPTSTATRFINPNDVLPCVRCEGYTRV